MTGIKTNCCGVTKIARFIPDDGLDRGRFNSRGGIGSGTRRMGRM